jgi:metal-dependent amidase/aminoacylase/carboxypeptidase family protein
MPTVSRITEYQDEMVAWRRDIHAHPELGFEENRTSDLVAAKLEEFGVEVHRGVGKTGVVGVLRAGLTRPRRWPSRRHGCAPDLRSKHLCTLLAA